MRLKARIMNHMRGWWRGLGRHFDFLIFTRGPNGSDLSILRSDKNTRNNFACPNEPLIFPWRRISAVVCVFDHTDNTRTLPYIECIQNYWEQLGVRLIDHTDIFCTLKTWKLVTPRFVTIRVMTRQNIRHIYQSDSRMSNFSYFEFFSCFSWGVI